jgi:ankyrin repeat protein
MHRSLQHLVSLLQQEDSETLLFPGEDGDNPLHSIVRLARPVREKEELLVALLTHSVVDVNSHGKGGMTALHYAVQVGVV